MWTVKASDGVTGATRGFIRLGHEKLTTRLVDHCDRGSHYIAMATASLVRQRYQADFGDLLSVTKCLCPVGEHYERQAHGAAPAH